MANLVTSAGQKMAEDLEKAKVTVKGHWRMLENGRYVYVTEHTAERETAPETDFIAAPFTVTQGDEPGSLEFRSSGYGLTQQFEALISALRQQGIEVNTEGAGGYTQQFTIPIEEFAKIASGLGPVSIDYSSRKVINDAETALTEGTLDEKRAQSALLTEARNAGWFIDITLLSPSEVDKLPFFNDHAKKFIKKALLGKARWELTDWQIRKLEKFQMKLRQLADGDPALKARLYSDYKAHRSDIIKKMSMRGLAQIIDVIAHQDILQEKAEQQKVSISDLRADETKRANLIAAQDDPNFVPAPGINTEDLDGKDLREYQKKGANWLMNVRRGSLALAPALGKTFTAIAAVMKLKEQGKVKTTMVFCPGRLKYGWYDSIKQLYPNAKVMVVRGNSELREMLYQKAHKADFVIASYDMARIDGEKIGKIRGLSCIINDEAHRLKNFEGKTTKEYLDNLNFVPYMFDLTGTPMPNRPEELFSTFERLNPTVLNPDMKPWRKALNTFKNFYCYYEKVKDKITGEIVEAKTGYKNLDKLRALLAPHMMRRTFFSPDVKIQMPEFYKPKPRALDMEKGGEQEKMYVAAMNNVLDTLVGEEESVKDGRSLRINHILSLFTRLEQIAIDPNLIHDGKLQYKGEVPKYEEATDLIYQHFSSGDTKGVAVFCRYPGTIPEMKKRLLEVGIKENEIATIGPWTKEYETPEVTEGFNSGRYKVLLSTDIGGEGLNLHKSANTIIHLDVPWTPKTIIQRDHRIYRPGMPTDSPCVSLTLTMRDSVEDRKLKVIERKKKAMDAILGEGAGDVSPEVVAGDFTFDDWLEIAGFSRSDYEKAKRDLKQGKKIKFHIGAKGKAEKEERKKFVEKRQKLRDAGQSPEEPEQQKKKFQVIYDDFWADTVKEYRIQKKADELGLSDSEVREVFDQQAKVRKRVKRLRELKETRKTRKLKLDEIKEFKKLTKLAKQGLLKATKLVRKKKLKKKIKGPNDRVGIRGRKLKKQRGLEGKELSYEKGKIKVREEGSKGGLSPRAIKMLKDIGVKDPTKVDKKKLAKLLAIIGGK